MCIDGREIVVDAIRVKPGTWSLLLDGRSYLVDVDETKQPNRFHTHKATTPILLESAQRKRLAQQAGMNGGGKPRTEVVSTPIAGRVVTLLVEVGDVVSPGQGLIILEAMKMENEIKAERGGVVEKIYVEVGQSVETGLKLITLQPVPE